MAGDALGIYYGKRTNLSHNFSKSIYFTCESIELVNMVTID